MAMAHIDDPLRSRGLKPLSAMLVDPQAAAAQKMLSDAMSTNKWTWETVPLDFPYYWAYAAMDPVLTCRIYEKLRPQIESSYRDVYELEMGTTRVISKMERKGARVDLAYCESKQSELMTWAARAKDWLASQYGITSVNSAVQLVQFFKAEGFDFTKTTAGGQFSMDKEVLEAIDHDVARMVLAVRKAEKNVGPYFSNFINLVDSDDRVHPNIWTMGTRTARMSITDPALQTLPRKDPTVRTAFIPTDDHVLITCDYDQIEARLMAHFSEDPGLIAAFNSDDDFFCRIASDIFAEPVSKKDQRRQLTKNTVYGKMYGAGAPKMALTAGVSLGTMEAVVAGFDSRFPGVRQMQRQIQVTGDARLATEGVAYINTPTGRRLVADPGKAYTLTNYLIQSHAAEILKRKIVELDAVLDDDWMILPVHDELVFDVPADVAMDARRQIEETMADATNYRVPITASSDLLPGNWGDKYRE